MKYVQLAFVVICVVAVVEAAGRRSRLPMPLLLTCAGVLLSGFAHLDDLHDRASILFAVLIPPLLYIEAWLTPRRELRQAVVPVLGLAVGLVSITIVTVAYGSRILLPGLSLAGGFAMAAALAPTDTVAVATLAKTSPMSTRLKTILNGEGLLNDAVALVVFQLAVGAAVSGKSDPAAFLGELTFVAAGGIATGVAVAIFGTVLRRQLKSDAPEHACIDTLLSLMTPYAAFLASDKLHVSGVLAVVAAGLTAGRVDRSHLDAELRVHGKPVWSTLALTLNGVVFVLLGLEIRQVLERLPMGFWELLTCVGFLTAALLLVRTLWMALAVFLFNVRLDGSGASDSPGRKGWHILMSTCCGVRGSLSLTAALSIPLVTASHAPFPGRDAIVALSAGTVLATLLVNSLAALTVGARGRRRPATEGVHPLRPASNLAESTLPLPLAMAGIDPANEPALGNALLRMSLGDRASRAQAIESGRQSLDRLARQKRISEACRRECEAELDLAELAARIGSRHVDP